MTATQTDTPPAPLMNRDPARATAKREIERLIHENEGRIERLRVLYKEKIDFLDEQIDRLTDSYVSDRLIAKKRREVSALIADFNSKATPLQRRREQLELALKALAQEEAEATLLGVPKPDESTRTHSDQFSHQERRPWTKKSKVDRQILWDPAAGELTEVRFDRPVWAGGEANTDSHSIDRSLYDDQEPAQPDLPVEVRSDEPELPEDPDFDRRWQEALAFAKERKWKEGSPNKC